MSKFKNLFIYVSDALRYDYVPKSIEEGNKIIKTLAPALYTPISFSSLVSGLNPQNHNVRCFRDTLDPKIQTVFDLFENHCYYDHPDDPMCKNVFKNYNTPIELTEIEEPFIWIERALDTHEPYGEVGHGGEIPENRIRSKKNKIERYKKGVKSTEKHFWSHVEELERRGIKDETLIIFTSDHGEIFGEKRRVLRKRYEHNNPMTKELAVVPTIFLNSNIGSDHMRTIDIIPTALDLMGEEGLDCDGISVLKNGSGTGKSIMIASNRPPVAGVFAWVYENREWERKGGRLKNYTLTLLKDSFGVLRKIKRKVFSRKEPRQKTEEEIEGVDI